MYPRAALFALLTATAATAQAVPLSVQHQGRVLDAAGGGLNGPTSLAFTLYDAPEGGSALWSLSETLPLSDGYYAITLMGLDSDVLDGQTRYLEVAGPGGPLLPRTALVSVPYAVRAGVADSVDASAGVKLGDPGDDACTQGAQGTLRWTTRVEVCTDDGWRTVGSYAGESSVNPALSCAAIHADVPALGSGPYWLRDSIGNSVQAWCDMETDGGGWTLAVNIHSDLGAINLFTYNNRNTTYTGTNYGIAMNQMGITTRTEYRLTCVESSDNTTRKLFIRGLNPAQPIFQAAGTISTGSIQCATDVDYSNLRSGAGCVLIDDNLHTYYGASAIDVDWALFSGGTAYTLRHCAARGAGYHNRGAIWYR